MGYSFDHGIYRIEEWKDEAGRYHRVDGPAVVWTIRATGIVVDMEYFVNGVRHREDGPALLWFSEITGELTSSKHYQNGVALV